MSHCPQPMSHQVCSITSSAQTITGYAWARDALPRAVRRGPHVIIEQIIAIEGLELAICLPHASVKPVPGADASSDGEGGIGPAQRGCRS